MSLNKIGLAMFLSLSFIVSFTQGGFAQNVSEKEIQADVIAVDREARNPEGERIVRERLRNRFNVTEDRIERLRNQNLNHGEISMTLAIANQMPGGINDQNVQRVLQARENDRRRGWGNVARSVGVNLGQAVSEFRHIRPDRDLEQTRRDAQRDLDQTRRDARRDLQRADQETRQDAERRIERLDRDIPDRSDLRESRDVIRDRFDRIDRPRTERPVETSQRTPERIDIRDRSPRLEKAPGSNAATTNVGKTPAVSVK